MKKNYGIEQLKQQARIIKNTKGLESDYKDLMYSVYRIENKIRDRNDDGVKEGLLFLRDLAERIRIGLKNWGDEFIEQKKRQEKRYNDVFECLMILDPSARQYKNTPYNPVLFCEVCDSLLTVFAYVNGKKLCRECA